MIEQYLIDLENRIDPAVEEQLLADWKTFLDGHSPDAIFAPRRTRPIPPAAKWPDTTVNQALDSPDIMALQQLGGCSATLTDANGTILNIRTNYGSGILSSLFGAEIYRMPDDTNTLPITRPLTNGADAVRRILDAGQPDLNAGWGRQCFDTARHFTWLLAPYPNLTRYVHIYHPDIQGPMDVADLLLGAQLFLLIADQPQLIHDLLDLITGTYLRFMREWYKIIPPLPGPHTVHWGLLFKGRLMLRDDSAMNLSPAMFDEFVRPYDQRLLLELGGGAIHFCGRGSHYIHLAAEMKNLHGINLSQPELNDMETIYRHTVDRGIPLLGLPRPAAESALSHRRDLRRLVHCW